MLSKGSWARFRGTNRLRQGPRNWQSGQSLFPTGLKQEQEQVLLLVRAGRWQGFREQPPLSSLWTLGSQLQTEAPVHRDLPSRMAVRRHRRKTTPHFHLPKCVQVDVTGKMEFIFGVIAVKDSGKCRVLGFVFQLSSLSKRKEN